MRWIPDRTGRFSQRPFWLAKELDAECEAVVSSFLKRRRGDLKFPLLTDDLTVLLEEATEDLDMFADLAQRGADVEGVTDFFEGRRPRVSIDRRLAQDPRRENRLRTTLTHEFGHVRLHAFLWDFSPRQGLFDDAQVEPHLSSCRRETMVSAPTADWMEWQAAYASGALLMPATILGEAVSQVHRRAGRVGPVQSGSSAASDLVAAVQAHFAVSEEAAQVRLTKLNHIVSAAQPESGFFVES